MLPSSALYTGSATWDQNGFISFAKCRGQLPPWQGPGQSWPMILYSYMKNRDIIWCPSDPNRNDTNAPDGVNGAVSYYWKAAIDIAWFGGAGIGVCRKEGDFDYPADQIIFWEHNGWHWGDASKGASNGVSFNVTYLDGHAQTKRITSSGYDRTENPVEPLPKSGVGEPAFFNYDMINNVEPNPPVGAYADPHTYADSLP